MLGGRSTTWLWLLVIALATGPAYALMEGPSTVPMVEGSSLSTGAVVLPHIPADYDWWNGCSPTAAGMLFGWWEEETSGDYDAFPGDHRNLPDTYGNTSSNPDYYTDARGVIAGWAHKAEGISQGLTYGSFENHAPDSLADFLLTKNGNSGRSDMAHGLEAFAAWDDPRTFAIESRRFSTTTVYTSDGWTFADYCAEIDAGRPVHLGLDSLAGGHSVLGVGYNNTEGQEKVVLLTTWHQGLQEWEWHNSDPSEYSAYAATLMEPVLDPTPELSAYVSIAHTRVRELTVTLGVGDPNNPDWGTVIWNKELVPQQNIVITDIDCTEILDEFQNGELEWFLRVYDNQTGHDGTLEDFQIRCELDEMVYEWEGGPVAVPARTTGYAYLTTTPQIPGDATGDGIVDEADAARLSENWGLGNATRRMGDFDGDDIVGPGDASILAANWGYNANEQGHFDAAAVPEPSTWLLLLGILPWFLGRKNRS